MFSLDVNATSETGFYLLELAKILVIVAPIALVLLGAILLRRAAPSRGLAWLIAATTLWLMATLLSRLALSSPVQHHYMSGTFHTEEALRAQTDFYFAMTSLLWTAEQMSLFFFGITLFLVFRSTWLSSTR